MIEWRLPAHDKGQFEAPPEVLAAAHAMPDLFNVVGALRGVVHVATRGVVGVRVEGPLRVVVDARHMSRAVTLGLVLRDPDAALAAIPAEAAEDPDLLRVLAMAFCAATGRLLQRGPRRDYVPRSRPMDGIRGEVDLDRWHGPRSPDGGARPWCRFRERDADIPEHRILKAALKSLARLEILEGPLRRRAASLTEALAGVEAVAPPPAARERLRTTGLFSPYAEPVALARVLLEGLDGGGGGPSAGRGFLLDLDRLFERWLARELDTLAPPGWRVTAQEAVSISEPRLDRYLDVAVWDEGRRLHAILDAKNKTFKDAAPPPQDVHQLIAYMSALRCPRGALVGLHSLDRVATRTYTLAGGAGRLSVCRLPARGSMAHLAAGLREWWPAFLGAVG